VYARVRTIRLPRRLRAQGNVVEQCWTNRSLASSVDGRRLHDVAEEVPSTDSFRDPDVNATLD
jgi:hypothetical protein